MKMFNQRSMAISLLVAVLGLGSIVPVSAQEGADPVELRSEEQVERPSSSLEERQNARRAENSAQLAEARQNAARANCEAVTARLAEAIAAVDASVATRTERQASVEQKITSLIQRLRISGVDADAIQASLDGYISESAAVTSLIATYQVALADAQAVDCSSFEPGDLLLALDEAKTVRTEIRTLMTASKDTLLSGVIPQLQAAVSSLADQAPAETNPVTEDNPEEEA